jgi:hypothetical protein
MKKLLLLIFLIPLISTGQKKYGDFNLLTSNYDISVTAEGKSKGEVYMDIEDNGKASINFKSEKERNDFSSFLSKTVEKFKEWKKTAKENNVKDVVKEIDNGDFGNLIAFSYGGWKFSFGKHNVAAIMLINDSGNIFYALRFPKVTASDNDYIESDASVMITSNEDEILNIIELLKTETINGFIDGQNKKEDLFN